MAASEPKSVDAYKERVGLLKEMLPTKDNNVYCSFDKDSLTDKSDKYKFKLTDDTIIGVNEGVISYRKDGTCIILMQNNKKATDRKYYKVKVEGGKLYDASKNPPKLVSMGKSDGGGQNPEPTKPIESITSGKDNGHEWVDLGLSVKWATCNVGASSPGEYGINFAWGEIAPKSEYEWENLKYRVSAGSSGKLKFSKYVATGEYGLVDNRTRLELSDDAAYEQWGGGWRMPTEAECQELVDKCQWSWTTEGGHVGYRVTGPNGRSIFLPAAGCRGGSSLNDVGDYGSYWSSSLYTSNSNGASYLGFNSGDHYVSNGLRRLGRSVRPVTE
ncbi:MAG: hypothetical protein Q4E55_08010 [Bacteroidales bacterium]|nr:hypothetical protein [Bacteroidales bacterium]